VATIEIEVASRPEASDILSSPERCAEFSCLISIGHGQDPLPTGYENARRKLRLVIADVTTDDGATQEDVRQIIELADDLRRDTGKVLIHCEAGVSRSTAAALIMHACWLGPGREREAMDRVRAQRPVAMPNPRMVQLADRLLKRRGRLMKALG